MTINQQQLPLSPGCFRGLEDLELALRRCKNEVWELGRREIWSVEIFITSSWKRETSILQLDWQSSFGMRIQNMFHNAEVPSLLDVCSLMPWLQLICFGSRCHISMWFTTSRRCNDVALGALALHPARPLVPWWMLEGEVLVDGAMNIPATRYSGGCGDVMNHF